MGEYVGVGVNVCVGVCEWVYCMSENLGVWVCFIFTHRN